MPYVQNQNTHIHYQCIGQGVPLVLHHGFGSNLNRWTQLGYVHALQQDYQLIMLDARGHGLSDKPHDQEAYALPKRVQDVLAVLDALSIQTAHFLGYSMGGWIGFGMAKHAPERLRSLIIGGMHVYTDQSFDGFRTIDGRNEDAFIAAFEAVVGERLPPEARPLLLANDLQALTAAAQPRASLEDVLPQLTMPCLLFVGEHDARLAAVKECAKRIAGATYVCVPGTNHITAFSRSDLILPYISRFLRVH